MPSVKTQPPIEPEAHLAALVQSGKVPHALLFAGTDPTRMAQAARLLAALLFCRTPKAGRSCGLCESCRLLETGNHPDLRWTLPEETGVIKIDAIRELTREASLKPYCEACRVFVIEHAEGMNEHAQNALLKTLEEPPGPSHILLLSEAPENLLPTVRSRTQRVFFASTARSTEAAEAEEAGRKEALDYLFAQLQNPPDWSRWERSAVLRVLEAVLGDLRDVLVIASGAAALSRADHRPFKERAARGTDAETVLEMLEKISSFKESIRQNAGLKLALAVLWEEITAHGTRHTVHG